MWAKFPRGPLYPKLMYCRMYCHSLHYYYYYSVKPAFAQQYAYVPPCMMAHQPASDAMGDGGALRAKFQDAMLRPR